MNAPDSEGSDRNLWMRFVEAHAGSEPSPCPDANVMAAYLDGALSERETEGLEGHLVDCDACLTALRELRSAAGEALADRPRRLSLLWRASLSTAAAAAIVAACVGGARFGEAWHEYDVEASAAISAELSGGYGDRAPAPAGVIVDAPLRGGVR